DGGRILGGSVLAYDAALSVSSHHGNALDGVAYSGRLALDQQNAFLRVLNGSSIEGLVDMSAGSPELRFSGSPTLNTITIMMSGTQHWFSSETAGQTLTFGQNSVVDGRNFTNGPRTDPGASPFETIVIEGGWNVRGGGYWQVQGASHLINRGTITIDPGGELVTSTGLDLAQGNLTIAPGGRLTITQTAAGPLAPSFFDGGITNQGSILIGADVDLQGRSINLDSDHGRIVLGSDYFSGFTAGLRNGSVHVGQGASLSLDHASVSLRDVRVSGLLTVESSAHGHFLNTVVDHVVVRGGSATVDSSAFAHTTFDGGTITASDLSDLGHIHLSGHSSTRTLRVTGEAVEGGVFHFDADARLTVETPFASTLVNRVDWRLAQGVQLTLNAGGVRNEADIVLDDASLRLTGVLPFTNPGTLTL